MLTTKNGLFSLAYHCAACLVSLQQITSAKVCRPSSLTKPCRKYSCASPKLLVDSRISGQAACELHRPSEELPDQLGCENVEVLGDRRAALAGKPRRDRDFSVSSNRPVPVPAPALSKSCTAYPGVFSASSVGYLARRKSRNAYLV